jgi:hypothetical protein
MATLVDSLSQALTPDVAGQIGKIAGLDSALVSKGMAVAGPLVAGSLAKQASSPTGLNSLMNMLPGSTGAGLGSILGALTGGGNTNALASGLFGGGMSAIGATLDKALGFKVSPLLPVAIPFVLTFVRHKMTTENLDQAGVARLLQDEQATFARTGGERPRSFSRLSPRENRLLRPKRGIPSPPGTRFGSPRLLRHTW